MHMQEHLCSRFEPHSVLVRSSAQSNSGIQSENVEQAVVTSNDGKKRGDEPRAFPHPWTMCCCRSWFWALNSIITSRRLFRVVMLSFFVMSNRQRFLRSQINIAEKIWDCAKRGDAKALANHLVGVTANELHFEKVSVKGCTLSFFRTLNTHELFQEQLTPLAVAASCGHVLVVKMLISAGADVNLKTSAVRSIYALASIHGVAFYCCCGGTAVMSLQHGRTALLWAAERGHIEVVQVLLEAGTDVNAGEVVGCQVL